jgi:hypothetical protein
MCSSFLDSPRLYFLALVRLLQVLKRSGTQEEKRYASIIMPVGGVTNTQHG